MRARPTARLFSDLTVRWGTYTAMPLTVQRDLASNTALALLDRVRITMVILKAIPSAGSQRSLAKITVELGKVG